MQSLYGENELGRVKKKLIGQQDWSMKEMGWEIRLLCRLFGKYAQVQP